MDVTDLFAPPLYQVPIQALLNAIVKHGADSLRLPELIGQLLKLSTGALYILSIAKEQISSLDVVITTLIDQLRTSPPNIIGEALQGIAALSVGVSADIRERLLARRTLPSLCFHVTCAHIHDEVEFLCSVLPHEPWLCEYTKKSNEAPAVVALRTCLYQKLMQSQSDQAHGALASALRAYCVLASAASVRLSTKEITACVNVLTLKWKSLRVTRLGVCFVLSCPMLLKVIAKEIVEAALHASTTCDTLLLAATHFHASRTAAVADLVRSTLGLPMGFRIEGDGLTRVGDVVTSVVLPEKLLCARILALPPVTSLGDDSSCTIAAVSAIVSDGACMRQSLDAHDWILAQWDACPAVDHPLMSQLVTSLVRCIKPASATQPFAMQPFSSKQVTLRIDVEQNEALSALMMYYVLCVRCELWCDRVVHTRTVYDDIIHTLPVKLLVDIAQRKPLYLSIRAHLLTLAVRHFPQLFIVRSRLGEHSLLVENVSTRLVLEARPPCQFTAQVITDVLRDCVNNSSWASVVLQELGKLSPQALQPYAYPYVSTRLVLEARPPCQFTAQVITDVLRDCVNNSSWASVVLQELGKLSPQALQPYASPLANALTHLLSENVPYRVLQEYERVWHALRTVMPWQLTLLTISAMRERALTPDPVKPMTVINDPLVVLRCDMRVFKLPPLFRILLEVVDVSLTASRAYYDPQQVIQQNAAQHTEKTEKTGLSSKEEERIADLNAVVLSNDSAAIQILLEVCIHDEDINVGTREEVSVLVCAFVHQMFITYPALIKLVHFQTYAHALVPVVVAGVSSMHVCLDFVHELVTHAQYEKQAFGMLLAGHLIHRYPIQKSLEIAKMTVAEIRRYIGAAGVGANVLIAGLPALGLIATAFPVLVEDITEMLLRMCCLLLELSLSLSVRISC
eukprot:TRINITY_DN426_c0_g2_i1.p1 TRINITY_DN426_c0_g2~~TRINITY_DN426_c0_g2_i1.p1  ORF type:complete len:1009 (+),score=197.89 TRINITY_DN426_c0_g2_i1:295-3027(+)